MILKPTFFIWLCFLVTQVGEGFGYLKSHLLKPCLFLCTSDSKSFKTESEPQSLWRSPWAALSSMASLPGCQGSSCWASWEHTACWKSIPFRSCGLCQGSTVPTKAHTGATQRRKGTTKPQSLADTHCLGAFCYSMPSSGNRQTDTGPHKRNLFFNEENFVPDKK